MIHCWREAAYCYATESVCVKMKVLWIEELNGSTETDLLREHRYMNHDKS